jgi:large subunit ribosomal protein L23
MKEINQILISPLVSEKTTKMAESNQYVFRVHPKANKKEIKKAIEDWYGVDVLEVKIIKIPPKKRRLGRISGWRKGYKKAIVKIKKGQRIELAPT